MPHHQQWHQYMIEFPDPSKTDHTCSNALAPALGQAQDEGLLDTWWYIRKPPGWRLRLRADTRGARRVEQLLTALERENLITAWTPGIYEAETRAFGGPAAMDVAHTLFHHDSRHLLQPPSPLLGRRETTALLYSHLLRAAGLDWFEQGDTWATISDLRAASRAHALTPGRQTELERSMRSLMISDPSSDPGLLPPPWLYAFSAAGQELAALARRGELQRGIRAVLAHHFIFHANRADLSGPDQATLAALAAAVVFGHPDPSARTDTTPDTTKVRNMTTTLSDTPANADAAQELRTRLADQLRKDGTVRSDAVDSAIRTVPRHLFVPGVGLDEAYANDAVYIKHDGTGASISAASQPTIVAMMLEQLDAQPGDRVLELGAGTGYNCALLGELVGADGQVVAVDVDDDLVEDARAHLAAAGASNVTVVKSDGALGHPDAAPYDRVIATVGAHEVPPAWLDQLSPAGRLVVPVRLAGAASRSIIFERGPAGWVSRGSAMAVFMPLRGIGDDSRRVIDLTGDGAVTLQVHKDNEGSTEPTTLTGVLHSERHEVWTDVIFAAGESFAWLDLWLCCRLDNPLMRMNVEPAAKESGLVQPMFPSVAMASTTADGSLAYLTVRKVDPDDDGGRRFEVGVIGHGPAGGDLAARVSQEIAEWDAKFRHRLVSFEIPDHCGDADPTAGHFVLTRPNRPITVTWE